jgi:phosphate transport system substrate-binding protein
LLTHRRAVRYALAVPAAGVVTLTMGLGQVAQAASSSSADPQLAADLHTPHASLTGAGSTFDQPFFTRAFYLYHQHDSNVTVNYASIGSGGGIKQFQSNTVNFGASDVPMGSSDIAIAQAKGGPVLQIPVALGGEAISYNLPGVKTGLHMTGLVLADIYLGRITKWNAAQIRQLNPKVKLPNESITVIHRSDASGTSYIFTNYLSVVSAAWAHGPGASKSPDWPVGLGGKGNEGVAGLVQQTAGSIGYVELNYALVNHFTYCAMKNLAGQFLIPNLNSVKADAAQKPNVNAQNFSIVNEPGKASYPISGYSWVLVYAHQTDSSAGVAVAKMLDWLTHTPGQANAQALAYVPLPPNIQALARSTISRITVNGKEALTG